MVDDLHFIPLRVPEPLKIPGYTVKTNNQGLIRSLKYDLSVKSSFQKYKKNAKEIKPGLPYF